MINPVRQFFQAVFVNNMQIKKVLNNTIKANSYV